MSQAPTPQATPSADIAWTDANRAAHFHHWLSQIAPSQNLQIDSLRLASADASFRRYFRIDSFESNKHEGQRPILHMNPPARCVNCLHCVPVTHRPNWWLAAPT